MAVSIGSFIMDIVCFWTGEILLVIFHIQNDAIHETFHIQSLQRSHNARHHSQTTATISIEACNKTESG